ncbi:MAG: penicillin-binding protein activator [Hyphomicrobiales bacterium]|nr:penicillin-binding protein activator [Hyphomicrobiales bacterium]
MSETMINRRSGLKFLGASALSSSLAACGSGLPGFDTGLGSPPAAGPAPPPSATAGVVPVALIVPLTAGGQGGIVGNALKNAAEMALAEFQNPNIRLIVKDDAGTADTARTGAQEALAEGAEVIIGPLFAPSVQAVASVARPAGRPVIAFSTDQAVAAPGVYLMSFVAELEVSRVISYAAQQGRRSFAALIPDTAYGRVVEAAFQQACAQRQVRVVAIERFALDQGKLQEAVGRLAPALAQIDALFAPETADTLPAIGQALQGAGLNSQRVKLLGSGVWNDARAFRVPQLQGGWFAAPEASGFNAFAQRYQARFGSAPTRIASLAYTAVTLVAALARQQGTQRFSEAVLTNSSGFEGVDGLFRFRRDGMIERGLAVLEVRNGTAVTVSAAPREFARTA